MRNSRRTQLHDWSKFTTWHNVLAPSRPAADELSLFRGFAQQVERGSTVGVLGSTAEFRVLLREMGFKRILIFEKFQRFYEYTTREIGGNRSEEVVLGDWRQTLAHHKGRLSLLMSDLTSGNIPYEDRQRFYSDVAGSLSEKGLFADKILTHGKRLPGHVAVASQFKNAVPDLGTLNCFNCRVLFCSDILRPGNVLDTTVTYQRLLRQFPSGPVHTIIERVRDLLTPPKMLWYYGRPWEEEKIQYLAALSPLYEQYEGNSTSPYYKNARYIISKQR